MRKIIKLYILEKSSVMYALCDDGSVWYRHLLGKDHSWKEVVDKVPSTVLKWS